jgi:hypothetical protein
MGRTQQLFEYEEEGVFDTFVSLCLSLFLSSVLVFGLFEILFILPHASKNSTFFNTHKRKEKKRKEERLLFSSDSSHALLRTHTEDT